MANKVKAGTMKVGQLYRELGTGQVINLHFFSDEGRLAVVSAPGESGLQNQWGIPVQTEVAEVPNTSTDGKCPACGGDLEPTNNPYNAEVRTWSHWCRTLFCGWMGNVQTN